MANAQFLSDLSEGIFERLGGLRREQEAKDEQRRSDTIKLLSGLAGQIEPESLPLLMGHIGDTIGIKGKMRKFWDAFSGMPDRSIEDQLGTKLGEVSGMLVGPDTARKARAGGDMARLFQPQTPEQQANQQRRLSDEQGLQGKMIFRDPRKEKIEEIESRYGAQLAQNLQLKDIAHQHDLDKQAERFRLQGVQDKVRYNQKIFQARDRVAEDLLGSGKARTLPEAQQMASTYLADKSEAELDNINALGELRRSLTTKAQAEIKAIGPGGLKPTDIDRRTKNFLTAQENAIKSEGSIKGIKEEQAKLIPQIEGLINKYKNYKFRFNPDTGDIESVGAPEGEDPGLLKFAKNQAFKQAEKQISDYRELLNKLKVEEAKAGGFKQSMEEYGKFRSTPKATPPQKPQKPLPRAGIGTTGVRVSKEQGDQSGYAPGMKVTIGPKTYTVEGLRNGFWILRPVTKD
jgi:hypothetical protein